MLNWLRRIIRNRRRAIFVYWDGLRIRRIDPIAAFRALKTHPTFDPDTHLALADLGDLDAIKVTLEATRDVFGITAFTDKTGGLIDDETLALIGDFFEYLASLKKSGRPSPTSSASTAPGQSPPANSTPPSASADYSSTPIALNCVDLSQRSGPSEQPSPETLTGD